MLKPSAPPRVVALAGNPNVGKSTVFNGLTGLRQHTGNWPGKTVDLAWGETELNGLPVKLVDLPGTYSLLAHSQEEETARRFLCSEKSDGVIVICDATCLERNLNLALQILEITPRVVLCVNLIDEAERKGIRVDCAALSESLRIPVVATDAAGGQGLSALLPAMNRVFDRKQAPPPVRYPEPLEQAVAMLTPLLPPNRKEAARWLALRLLECPRMPEDETAWQLREDPAIATAVERGGAILRAAGLSGNALGDAITAGLSGRAEKLCAGVVSFSKKDCHARDRKIDKWLTSRRTGLPIMLALLAVVFWLTLSGANYPSALLSGVLFRIEDWLLAQANQIGAPPFVSGMFILGAYRVAAWVVSVMLPPMAIFFPLFALLEDLGYLPRVAFNLDHRFQKSGACGKQALTMCMGFGCNAAGVTGCRIIDSARERLIAIVTNNFVPCNGRFPFLISVVSVFFLVSPAWQAPLGAILITCVIVLGIGMTFLSSRLLSATLMKGTPSAFTLELPPYRKPRVSRIIIRSFWDRTLFVLGRAAAVAAPAGLIIWLTANITVGEVSLLTHCASFLDPFARLFGMDGVILMAFILGWPANEIVMPVILMAYLSQGSLAEMSSLAQLRDLFIQNGWSWLTAVCVMMFSLMHWPCSTTCLTIKKETGSVKWTLASLAVPTLFGLACCFLLTCAARLLGLG